MKLLVDYNSADWQLAQQLIDYLGNRHTILGRLSDLRPDVSQQEYITQNWYLAERVIVVLSPTSPLGTVLHDSQLDQLQQRLASISVPVLLVAVRRYVIPPVIAKIPKIYLDENGAESFAEIDAWLDSSDPTVLVRDREAAVSTSEKAKEHLVILVHGANTEALWTSRIKPTLERAGYSAESASWGKNNLRALLMQDEDRDEALQRLEDEIRQAILSYRLTNSKEPERKSIIAHSFGCYLFCLLLQDATDLEWDRIVFCGSVVREDFRFDQVRRQYSGAIQNLVGNKDHYPVLAEWVSDRYGPTGRLGFNRSGVRDYWHDFGHSDCLTSDFCSNTFIPLLEGKTIPSVESTELSRGLKILHRASLAGFMKRLKIIFVVIVVIAVLSGIIDFFAYHSK